MGQSSGEILGTEELAPDLALRELATQQRGQRYKQMELWERNHISVDFFAKKVI